MCTLKLLYSIEIQFHERFHLKPKAAIDSSETSSPVCKTIFNGHNFQYNSLSAKFTDIKKLNM